MIHKVLESVFKTDKGHISKRKSYVGYTAEVFVPGYSGVGILHPGCIGIR